MNFIPKLALEIQDLLLPGTVLLPRLDGTDKHDDDNHNNDNVEDDNNNDNNDEHDDSDSNSGQRQRQRWQQQWPGAQTTIN